MSLKISISSSWRTEHFFTVIHPLLYLSRMLSHNSCVLLHLTGLNLSIKYLDMFWNKWILILWTEAGNKWSSCSDDSKYGAFILGQPEQQFKIKSHFGIFDPVTVKGQWYGDAASHAFMCICEIFGIPPPRIQWNQS